MENSSEISIDPEYLIYLEQIEKNYHALDHNFSHWKDKIVYPKSPEYYVSLQTNCMIYLNKFLMEYFNINLNVPIIFQESVQDSERKNIKNVYWKVKRLDEREFEINFSRIKVIYEEAVNLTPFPYLELVMRSIGKWIAEQLLTVEDVKKRVSKLRKIKGSNFILFENDYLERSMLSIPGIFEREFFPPLDMVEIVYIDDFSTFHEGKPYAYHFDSEDDSIDGIGVPELLAPMSIHLKSQKQINRLIINAQLKNLVDFGNTQHLK